MGLMARIRAEQARKARGSWQATLVELDTATTRTIAVTSEWVKRAQANQLPAKDYSNA